MSEAIVDFVGQHDFISFRSAGCSAEGTVRTIQGARLESTDDGEVVFEFEGHGFLRHQVRIMVGTLVEIGLGKRCAGDVQGIIHARDRAAAGQTAPAKGLTLVSVQMGDGPRRSGGREA